MDSPNVHDISKLENGNCNPSLNMLKKLAAGLDMSLKIEFVPKAQAWLLVVACCNLNTRLMLMAAVRSVKSSTAALFMMRFHSVLRTHQINPSHTGYKHQRLQARYRNNQYGSDGVDNIFLLSKDVRSFLLQDIHLYIENWFLKVALFDLKDFRFAYIFLN